MNRLTFAAAAALAVGGLTFTGCDDRDATTSKDTTTSTGSGSTAGQKTDNAIDRAGDAVARGADKAGDAVGRGVDKSAEAAREAGAQVGRAADQAGPSGEELRDVLAQVAEAALTENGLDDLTERLVDADRNRIGQGGQINGDDHNALVRQFRADWKAKYGQDFDITNEEAAFPAATFSVTQGEIPRGAAGASVEVDRTAGGGARVEVDPKSGVDRPDSPSADANRNDPGRNIAALNVAASHGMPAVRVPFIHEAGGWKLDVKDTIDAARLRANVVNHLKAAHGMKDQWPADVNQAYAAVTHHVLMALTDQQ